MKANFKKIFSFNIGEEINLATAIKKLTLQDSNVFKIKRFSRELVIKNAPLTVKLSSWDHELNRNTYTIEVTAKVWSFGVISIGFSLNSLELTLAEATELVRTIEKDKDLYRLARERVQVLAETLGETIVAFDIWREAEDYLIISLDNKGIDLEAMKPDLHLLMEGNSNEALSAQIKEGLRLATYQYTNKDLIIIDWNQAVIVGDEVDREELATILDFALCQLLVLRFYDDLLDDKLSKLYRSIRLKEHGFLGNKYSKLSRESSLLFIEFSDVIDNISNSFKFIGDTYYAQIYRFAIQRFRVHDFFQIVEHKLSSLGEVSKLFSSEVNEKRSQFMEIIIIVLIAIEVIPFVLKLFGV